MSGNTVLRLPHCRGTWSTHSADHLQEGERTLTAMMTSVVACSLMTEILALSYSGKLDLPAIPTTELKNTHHICDAVCTHPNIFLALALLLYECGLSFVVQGWHAQLRSKSCMSCLFMRRLALRSWLPLSLWPYPCVSCSVMEKVVSLLRSLGCRHIRMTNIGSSSHCMTCSKIPRIGWEAISPRGQSVRVS